MKRFHGDGKMGAYPAAAKLKYRRPQRNPHLSQGKTHLGLSVLDYIGGTNYWIILIPVIG